MSTPTEYRLLKERHEALVKGVSALANDWERRADAVAITYQDPEARTKATAPARALVRTLRALIEGDTR